MGVAWVGEFGRTLLSFFFLLNTLKVVFNNRTEIKVDQCHMSEIKEHEWWKIIGWKLGEYTSWIFK